MNSFIKILRRVIYFSCVSPLSAQLDCDGNHVSDLWQRLYPEAVLDGVVDSDSDGSTDLEEGCSGTNPFDAGSIFVAELSPKGEALGIVYTTLQGKWYVLEQFFAPGVWVEQGERRPGTGSEEVWPLEEGSSGIVRMKVLDPDEDKDGLRSWEELAFGYSDNDRYSNGLGKGMTDYAAAFVGLEGEGFEVLATGQTVERRPPEKAEVVRFLAQSTWGATTESVAEIENTGIGAWLHNQLVNVPRQSISSAVTSNAPYNNANFPYFLGMGILRASMNHEDQLSQRMAFALSEILVVSNTNDTIRGNYPLQRAYYTVLKDHSFGNYRELLDDITYSTAMGIYLSHVQNQKSDSTIGRLPDENYAREIMQLFTIGLYKLHQDGTPQLDPDGELIPTYDNYEITELAKVFTGFGFGGPSGTGFFQGVPGTQLFHPMKMYDEFHEPGPKTIVDGIVIPEGQTGEEDVDMALDILTEHANVGPFIGRLLIQRFVTSNPSPSYIERVAGVWNDNGEGERGDLAAVIRAILMDPEARNDQSSNDAFGRMRGPYERMVAVMRAFDARNDRTAQVTKPKYPVQLAILPSSFQHLPLWAPSVFNFYLPDHKPVGELRNRGLNAPELQIATDSTVILGANFLRKMIDDGLDAVTLDELDKVKLDLTDAMALALDRDQLLNYLNEVLLGGGLSGEVRAIVGQAYDLEPDRDPKNLVTMCIRLIVESPDFVILK